MEVKCSDNWGFDSRVVSLGVACGSGSTYGEKKTDFNMSHPVGVTVYPMVMSCTVWFFLRSYFLNLSLTHEREHKSTASRTSCYKYLILN